tara:strand:- start:352 stop:555 length:204 start_codon:yes stop_codon:yes gene_type:complete
MEIVAIIMHLVNGSVVEASVSATVPKMLCTQVVKQYVVFDEQNSKMLYEGEPVLVYYCKTKKGKLSS